MATFAGEPDIMMPPNLLHVGMEVVDIDGHLLVPLRFVDLQELQKPERFVLYSIGRYKKWQKVMCGIALFPTSK